MNAEATTAGAATTARNATPIPPAPFTKPRPGSWTLDVAHCERPMPRFVEGIFEASFGRGFRDGLAAYGALLETIEAALVNGFVYSCVRPLGAPAEPKGTPPKAIFKTLMALHPEIRRRVRLSEQAMNGRLWRDELRRYNEEWAPPVEREAERLLRTPLAGLDDVALAAHVDACYAHLLEATYLHHRLNCSRIVPVGDYMAHAHAWTDASRLEILESLRGASPDSRVGLAELEAVAGLIATDDTARRALESDDDPEEIIAALERREDAIGDAARAWLATVGHHLSGFSPGYPTLRETPAALVEALRAALTPSPADDAGRAGALAFERIRARVPEAHRAELEEIYREARDLYRMRDHLCFNSIRSFAATRLALLEAGRRLAARGCVHEPEAALDATAAELRSLLIDGRGPGADELQRRLEWRRTATAEHAPELLGPAPGAPPPEEWLPKGARRLQRAVGTYIGAMSDESRDAGTRALVKGMPASGGRRTGVARLVLEPGDFDRIVQGDILVARITTPAFNILLPMLAGIVTDRGGVLSHPAIVSREYGIPGVVGARNATSLITDGAIVEIDGDAGTVKVLA